MDQRRHVLYVSYDGIGEPLGQSQVLAYLSRLAATHAITLISFEKEAPGSELVSRVRELGIAWMPLSYHARPPLVSTARDVLAGVWTLRRVARRHPSAVVHVRSYVPALIALGARQRGHGRLLFDIRGFWADERVEGGLWRPGGVLYRIAKRCEKRFFAEAAAIVTLTEASVPRIRRLTGSRDVPVVVIPTCVDIKRFRDCAPRPGGPHAVWSGSIGTWYRFDLAAQVADALSMPLTVVSRQADIARRVLDGHPALVRAVGSAEVPAHLFAGDVGLSLIARSPSKVASAPTRVAEYLAAGMPVLATRIGDLGSLVEDCGVGVILEGDDEESLARAAMAMRRLVNDPAVSERCRRVAREKFDVSVGAQNYARLYEQLSPACPGRGIQ